MTGRRATAVLATGAFSVAAFVAIACSSVAHTSGGRGGSDSVVAVYPLAGTPDASSSSEISFRGIDPDKLTKVNVVGSKSGRHAGKLEAHSDGMGASFVPAKPFAAGEKVHVGANVPLVGQRGARSLSGSPSHPTASGLRRASRTEPSLSFAGRTTSSRGRISIRPPSR